MLHPKLTSLDGREVWLAEIGPFGAWSDLKLTFRWGQSACGLFDASWSMPLPSEFSHPLLRRGTLVSFMDGAAQVGSQAVLAQPARGGGYGQPWQLTATGVATEVTGDASWFAFNGSSAATADAQVAVDAAITNGLPWAGRDPSVPAGVFGGAGASDIPFTIGGLLSGIGDRDNKRWGVGSDGLVRFMSDPTTPTLQVTPDVVSLGVADDDYASVVRTVRIDSTSGLPGYTISPASPSLVEQKFRRREYLFDTTDLGPISGATAQALGDGFLAKAKGRMGWLDKVSVTTNELLTMGGVPANLLTAAEQVGTGLMVRVHGMFDDLVDFTGTPYLDLVMGQADYVEGSEVLDLAPLGFVARDLASVQEEVSGEVFGS